MMAALKLVGAPGSIRFLTLCCCVGLFLIYLWPRRTFGGVWLFAVFCVYALLGTPVVAQDIADALSQYRPVQELKSLPSPDVVVTLGGDNVRGRVSETLHAWAAWPDAHIIVFGDDWLFDHLLEAGIPAGQITHRPRPPTTFEQMAAVSAYLKAHPTAGAAVVASRLQMPRIAALAGAMRLHVTLLPSPVDVEPSRTGPRRWLPRYTALRLSRDAIYEHAALIYYRWKGLTASDRNPPQG